MYKTFANPVPTIAKMVTYPNEFIFVWFISKVEKKSVNAKTIAAGTINNKKLPATILKALISCKCFFTIFTLNA